MSQHKIESQAYVVDRVDPTDSTTREDVDVTLTLGKLRVIKLPIALSTAGTTLLTTLPAKAVIVFAMLDVPSGGLTDGTSFKIGGAVDDDSIFQLTSGNQVESVITSTGAAVGDSVGTDNVISIISLGTYTLGAADLTIMYVDIA